MVSDQAPLDLDTLAHCAAGLGEDVFRGKGFVWLPEESDHRYVYQQVGACWSLRSRESLAILKAQSRSLPDHALSFG